MTEFEFGKATVRVIRMAIHPCALDEYEVDVVEKNGNVISCNILADCFTSDYKLAERAYRRYLNN